MGADQLNKHPLNGMKFSTPDNDNDNARGNNCALSYKSYNNCYYINLNKQPPSENGSGNGNLLFTEMKIRPKDCIMQ